MQKKRVQKVLNHTAQVVTSSKRNQHATPLFTELNWLRLEKLILEKDIMTVHEILHTDTCPENLKALVEFRADVSTCSARAAEAGQLQLPKVHTERARRFFTYRALAARNGASATVRGAPTAKFASEGLGRGFRWEKAACLLISPHRFLLSTFVP